MKHHAQKQPKILKLCLQVSYNSGIILSKMFTYYSQNYAGIIGAGLLTADQREVYDTFCSMIESSEGGMLFLDAPGGTGKTFLINLILAKLRSEGKIALATASSGIAATLLTGGRTLHSTFKIPLDLYAMDIPICSIKKGTALCRVIQEGKATVVDEAPMTNLHLRHWIVLLKT